MKRVISIIFLILFLSSVFAEDFIIGEENPAPSNNPNSSGQIEIAQVRADIITVSNKVDSVQKNMLSKSDVNEFKDEVFMQVENRLNYFLVQVLLMLGVFTVFFFASVFVMKAKKWL